MPKEILDGCRAAIKNVEEQQKKIFGDAKNPLLVSVRSGARESMPGMMDTILNLGLNDESVKGLEEVTKDSRFAYDCYRRFIQMYADIVLDVGAETEEDVDPFDEVLDGLKKKNGVRYDNELKAEDLQQAIE